jgi:heparosan-N-sulfate-glucuronate 5-epimerase
MLKEILKFYNYRMANIPIFLTELRGPLDYFIWSDRLFGISIDKPSSRIKFDENSILMFDYGDPIGVKYNPAYIGWWGLINLKRYRDSSENRYLDNFGRQVNWFLTNQKEGEGESVVWHYNFDWQEGKTFLQAPWISAMSQGLAVSCLIRTYRLKRENRFLETAYRASRVFELGIKNGGVRTVENGVVFYEEYPVFPLVRILDGFAFGLLGLYDLYEETMDSHIKHLFDEGVEGVKSHLKKWNYRNIWSWYGRHGFLSPPEYNKLNAVLMGVLFRITHDPAFEAVWKAWDNEKKNYFRRAKTFFLLLLSHISLRGAIDEHLL